MITFYHPHKVGLFNGYRNDPMKGTVESQEEAVIIGDTKDEYVTRIMESSCPMSDEMGKYETHYCYPLGFHKSRLIKWQTGYQLNLFE